MSDLPPELRSFDDGPGHRPVRSAGWRIVSGAIALLLIAGLVAAYTF